MDSGGISAATIATSVWANATRSITSEAPALTAISTNTGSLAINTILDLRPAAGKFRILAFAGFTSSTGIAQAGWYDGTTFNTSFAQSLGWLYAFFNAPAVGHVIKNTSGANALTYGYSGWDIS